MVALLLLDDLRKHFPIREGVFQRITGLVKAIDGVSFQIEENKTFGLVGESGCGKSTLARCVLRLIEPTQGRITYDGRDITGLNHDEMISLRREMQIIFQDPYTALHPRRLVKDIVGEPLTIHNRLSEDEYLGRVREVMLSVGLTEEQMYRYPHEFSGGQRQRIMIARAIVLNPRFLVLDEPTSALDVSVQARILNLLTLLQKEKKFTYLLISHHLSVVEYMSDKIGVMYLGKLVEVAPKREIFLRPLHPYTLALLSAIPTIEARKEKKRIILKGEIPSPADPPSGCRFRTRCPYAQAKCAGEEPLLEEVEEDHFVACHFWKEILYSR